MAQVGVSPVTDALWVSAVRSALIAALLAWSTPGIASALQRYRWLWFVVLGPLLIPSLVLGYAYADTLSTGAGGELGYGCLLALRLFPIAVLAQALLPPPPMNRAAVHCARMLPDRPPGYYAQLHRNRWMIAGLMFVLAFQEFELASLCNCQAWTVWLFDAQTGGTQLSETLSWACLPVLIQAVVLGSVLVVFLSSRRHDEAPSPAPLNRRGLLWPWVSAVVVVAVPLAILTPGLVGMSAQSHVLTELWNSAVLSLAAVVCVMTLLRSCSPALLLVLSMPGLLGGLVLGLSIQAVFQLPGLAAAYDSPLPLILGWTLFLLPMGVVIHLAGQRLIPGASIQLAAMLRSSDSPGQARQGRRLEFVLAGLSRAMVPAVLLVWAFYEVVLGDLIAPSNMTPVAPRLYNLMHYGQSAGLSAMVLWMGALALALGLSIILSYRFYTRLRAHAF